MSRPRAEPASELVSAPVPIGDRTRLAESIEVAVLPEDVRPAIPAVLTRTALPRLDRASGTVAIAGGDPVCVRETAAGSHLQHTNCHTAAEWKELERRRKLDQLWDFTHNKAGGGFDPQ